ncbi:Protein kinase domain protein [Trypanosoma grayi]|uniref:Protein kinase domain protein n=1 Tax=Trypanosoma grayi TaxID=71804 RepID=UPI0004F4649E|nr:Protein kinase domain protein [Trypanosoma grayi]KEG06383.1 Protein kinase domain protein [Trypanosoma grayi]
MLSVGSHHLCEGQVYNAETQNAPLMPDDSATPLFQAGKTEFVRRVSDLCVGAAAMGKERKLPPPPPAAVASTSAESQLKSERRSTTDPCAGIQQPKQQQQQQALIPQTDVRLTRQLLGRGRQGSVWLGEDVKRCDAFYAVKAVEVPLEAPLPVHKLIAELRRSSDYKPKVSPTASPDGVALCAALDEETCLWRQLRHPSIVQLHSTDIVADTKDIVYRFFAEYMPCGSLSSFVRQHYKGGILRERALRWFLKPVVEALRYMHAKHVVHLDLKAENILVTWTDEQGRCGLHACGSHRLPIAKVGDFGCARDVGKKKNSSSSSSASRRNGNQDLPMLHTGELPSGTPGFIAPEVIMHFQSASDAYSTAADVWSFGCMVLQLLRGAPPVRTDLNIAAILLETMEHPKLVQRFIPPVDTVAPTSGSSCSRGITISTTLQDMLLQCLNPDPRKRPTAEQLLQHPFFLQECHPEDAAVGLCNPHAFYACDSNSSSSSFRLRNSSMSGVMIGSTVSTLFDGLSNSDEGENAQFTTDDDDDDNNSDNERTTIG